MPTDTRPNAVKNENPRLLPGSGDLFLSLAMLPVLYGAGAIGTMATPAAGGVMAAATA